MQDNGSMLMRVALLAALFACGAGAWAISYYWGPEAGSRAVMVLRTPTATPPPTPDPAVIAAQATATANAYKAGGTAIIVLIAVGTVGACIGIGSWAARAGTAAAVKAKAATHLPPWAVLPDKPILLGMGGWHEVYDPRFGSVRTLGAGDASPCLTQGELILSQPHPVAEIIAALSAVPANARGTAWRRAAQHYNLLESSNGAA